MSVWWAFDERYLDFNSTFHMRMYSTEQNNIVLAIFPRIKAKIYVYTQHRVIQSRNSHVMDAFETEKKATR